MKKPKNYLNFIKKKESNYILQFQPKDLNYFQDVYKNFNNNIINTNSLITENGYFQFGNNINEIIKRYKKPLAKTTLKKSCKINTIFYKQLIGKKKAHCEFSFYNNYLFHFSFSFKYLSVNEKEEIIKLISKKYLNKELYKNGSKIKDPEGNFIIIDDSVALEISYFAPNNHLLLYLKKLEETKVKYYKTKKNRQFSELQNIL